MYGCLNICIVYIYNFFVFDVKICVVYINRYYIVDGYLINLFYFLRIFLTMGLKKK